MAHTEEVRMLDIRNPDAVQVLVSADRKTLWVNIDGFCRLRVSSLNYISFEDNDKIILEHGRDAEFSAKA